MKSRSSKVRDKPKQRSIGVLVCPVDDRRHVAFGVKHAAAHGIGYIQQNIAYRRATQSKLCWILPHLAVGATDWFN
jgi:hypothetical protein